MISNALRKVYFIVGRHKVTHHYTNLLIDTGCVKSPYTRYSGLTGDDPESKATTAQFVSYLLDGRVWGGWGGPPGGRWSYPDRGATTATAITAAHPQCRASFVNTWLFEAQLEASPTSRLLYM